MAELEVLCAEAGRHNGGSISYLHRSAIGGLDQQDKDLLFRLGTLSRLPIILQGLGGRSKVDVPGAEWEQVSQWIEEVGRQGVGIFSLLAQPSLRPRLPHRRRHQPLRGRAVVAQGRWAPGWPGQDRLALLAGPRRRATRCATPWSTPTPTGAEGSTLPPPRWSVVEVDEVAEPAQREVRAPHHRRHRHRARQGAGRRAARPGPRRGPAHRLPLRQQEPGVGGGRRAAARATPP